MPPLANLALGAAAAAVGSAYLNARWSLEHDRRYFRMLMTVALDNFRAKRSGRFSHFFTLEEHAQDKALANRPCLLFADRSYTFAQAHDMAIRWGTWLQTTHGVRKGDIVAMDMQNSDAFFFAWFGLWSIGARPAFLNYNLTGKALAHSIRASTASLVLVDPNVQENITDDLRAEFPDARFVVLDPQTEAAARATAPVRAPDDVRLVTDPADMAMLIFTSGTTGLPKPAVVSWLKCRGGAFLGCLGPRLGPDDVLYTCMPLYHTSASVLGCLAALRSGSATALGRRFSTKTFWSDVRRHNASVIQYVGETCRYLLMAPPELDPVTGENLDRRHRVRIASGNGLRADVWARFQERFGIEAIWEVYAATEGPGGTFNLSRNDFGRGAIGRFGILSDAMVRQRAVVVALDPLADQPQRDPTTGLCSRVAPGTPGELLFKLPEDTRASFQGYYGNTAATNAKILRNVLRKGDAYFRTGDLVRWQSDGRVFFADRLGDTFRWKSENVSTTEVADAIGDHPAVHEVNVYGVEVPHHDGRAGCAAVVLGGGSADAPPDESVLRSVAAHALAALPRYAVPLFLRVARETGLQNTGTNKQQKHVLRTQGVRPDAVGPDRVFWLRDGAYVPFGAEDWAALEQAQVKL